MNEEEVKSFANIEAQRIIEQIISLRKKKGMSQELLAEKSGMSRNTIIQVEKKKVKISLVTFCALLKGLDVSYSEFFKITQKESDLANEFGDDIVELMKKLNDDSSRDKYINVLNILLTSK
ncbi:helix-turn-helix domain-containing protein [Enterococcus gallinarum]|uniref:helix-turn-helix domain-containing protein n=1 Tax=Enterococcus TaxID=1350 RepID=UPI0020910995|nr:helix-turn-helix transcriptional regulator [Enterococcus gallinarum]MCO5477148.1 helix-turn-helix domain-containing protein [Enterococcus gallinarum]